MKISIDDKPFYTIQEYQKNVVMNDLETDFDEDMKRRIKWVIEHKYEQCLKRMMDKWMPNLKTRYATLPTANIDLINLVITQPDYKTRGQQEAESASADKGEFNLDNSFSV